VADTTGVDVAGIGAGAGEAAPTGFAGTGEANTLGVEVGLARADDSIAPPPVDGVLWAAGAGALGIEDGVVAFSADTALTGVEEADLSALAGAVGVDAAATADVALVTVASSALRGGVAFGAGDWPRAGHTSSETELPPTDTAATAGDCFCPLPPRCGKEWAGMIDTFTPREKKRTYQISLRRQSKQSNIYTKKKKKNKKKEEEADET
jgi:hypothetical protein